MYDYEYEMDILLLLRLLWFLREDQPGAFAELMELGDELNLDTVYEMVGLILWGGYGFTVNGFDEENEMDVLLLSHPMIDRFLQLSEEWRALGGGGRTELSHKKVQDAVEFYVCGTTYSVFSMDFSFGLCSAEILLTLSPDSSEPLQFANSIVDLLLYFKQESQRLERLIQKKKAEDAKLDEMEKEAA